MKYRELIEKYKANMKAKDFSRKTIKRYSRDIELFTEYLKIEKGIFRIQEVTRNIIRDYEQKVHSLIRLSDGKALSASSKGLKIQAVINFFKYLSKRGELLYNPAGFMERPKVRKDRLREVLKVREINRLIDSIKGDTLEEIRDRAIMELLYTTGMRNTELRNIKPVDIDQYKSEVRIRKGKGGKQRIVPVGDKAISHIERYLKESRPVLVGEKDTPYLFVDDEGEKLKVYALPKMVRRYAERAKIKTYVNTHIIRHSCATHMLKGGADIRYVQEILGHESLDTTRLYTKVDIGDLKKVHKRTHPRNRL